MESIDTKNFEIAISLIKDGFLFEEFVNVYLANIFGHEFIPAGGIKDKGIDAFTHIFTRKGYEKDIFQSSIEKDFEGKLEDTLTKLDSNGIIYEQLFYVTNQIIKDKDIIIENLYSKYKKHIKIYDLKWLASYVNSNSGTQSAYQIFEKKYLIEYQMPGKSYEVLDIISDPRLYVFFRQQWDDSTKNEDINKFIIDTLILFFLEGTDPDKDIVKSKEWLIEQILKKIKISEQIFIPIFEERIGSLNQKPRKVVYHSKLKGYCLPYETREIIKYRNIEDLKLYEAFKQDCLAVLKKHLKSNEVQIKDSLTLIENCFHEIYYEQGLEFSNFILNSPVTYALEKNLYDILARIVDKSSVIMTNKQKVKASLFEAMREIIYSGSNDQREFLNKLSKTYMMLFCINYDPKIAKYFNSMASKLNIFVCTSILIPAFSEILLEPHNKRHWALLKEASLKNVSLMINDSILTELETHFRSIKLDYENKFKQTEDAYLNDDIATLYIDKIIIRSYFYSKKKGLVKNFQKFIDNFVSYDMKNIRKELAIWLKAEFNIQYVTEESLKIKIDKKEIESLVEELKHKKSHTIKAENDAKTILSVYEKRKIAKESEESSLFGYSTWWLSKDTSTKIALDSIVNEKYKSPCYLRPDFLYNYISLLPSNKEIDNTYKEVFPSLLGINLSYHLPKEVTLEVNNWILDHKDKSPARIQAIIGSLSDRIKVEATKKTPSQIKHYLDQQKEELYK